MAATSPVVIPPTSVSVAAPATPMKTSPIVIPPANLIPPTPATPSKIVRFNPHMNAKSGREALVKWWMKGHVYGHPGLFNIRYNAKNLTHDAYIKLAAALAKKGHTLNAGAINFIDSMCIQVPVALEPRNVKIDATTGIAKEKVGGGDSGVIVYTFRNIVTRPGSLMLIAAAESIIFSLMKSIVASMRGHGVTGKSVAHKLTISYISEFLKNTSDPLFSKFRSFYAEWDNGVPFVIDPKDKSGTKRFYLPFPVSFPDVEAVIGANQKYVVDKILETHAEVASKRGKEHYRALIESGKLVKPTKKPAAEKTPDASPEKTPSKRKPVKSDLQKAIEADRKHRVGKETSSGKEVEDIGYDISVNLSQGDFLDKILLGIPDAVVYIANIAPEVRRFIDDLFNRLVISFTELAISAMKLADCTKLGKEMAIFAIEAYFTCIYGAATSEVRRTACVAASDVGDAYEDFIGEKKKKEEERKKKSAATPAAAAVPTVTTTTPAAGAAVPTVPVDEGEDEDEDDDAELVEDDAEIGEDEASIPATPATPATPSQ